MVKTLLLTDLHLRTFCSGYLEAQIKYLIGIIEKVQPYQVIIMGDIFMHRKPSPSVLIALNTLLKDCSKKGIKVYILRGNHDSETKADDGITALSIFDSEDNQILVYDKIERDVLMGLGKCLFIPHYEHNNEGRIVEALQGADPEETVFGHFGFYGALNSVGDKDFCISQNVFKNQTYLGHIHKHGVFGNVTVLGTQYSTNFGEANNLHYYGVFEDKEFTLVESIGGPRHIVATSDFVDAEGFHDYCNDPRYFTLLRVLLNPVSQLTKRDIQELVKEKCPGVVSLDIKYMPVITSKNEISNYTLNKSIFSITPEIIETFVKEQTTELPSQLLMDTFKAIKDKDDAQYR